MKNKEEQPLISVVLPVYHIEEYLPACMESLKAQTYSNLELILVDDGSGEPCSSLCDRYAAELPQAVAYHKTNGGLSDARNYGIARAKGEFITLIDPDDVVDPDYVSYLYELILRYDTPMALCQHRVRFDNGNVEDYGGDGDECLSAHDCIRRMLYHDVIDTSAWAKIYRRELFDTIQYPVGKIFEDIGTTYALMIASSQIACGYASKYTYHFHSNSIVTGAFKPAKLDLLEMTDRMGADVIKTYPDLKNAVLRRQVYARLSTLNQMLDVNDYEEKRKEIIAFALKYKKQILSDELAPKRDKTALRLLSMGYGIYRMSWKQYEKRRKG